MRRPSSRGYAVLALCLVPLSFPLQQLSLPGLPGGPVQLATLAAVSLVALHQRARRRPLLPRSAILFAASLVVLSALVSSMVAVDPAAALRLDAGYLLGLALAAAVVVACPDRRSAQLLVACVCAAGVLVCAAGLTTVSQLRVHHGGGVVDHRATGLFGQPNELGAFAAVLVVLGTGLLFSAPGRLIRPLAGVSVLVASAALVASLSRGAWVGLALGLAVLVALVPAVRRPVVLGLLAVVVCAVSARVALPEQPMASVVADRVFSLTAGSANPYDHRPAIWAEAWRQVQQRPVLGAGPGGYPVLAARRPSQVTTVAPYHAHGLVLTLAAEQGVIGVLALAAAVGAGVVAVGRTVRGERTWRTPDRLGTHRSDGTRELLAGTAAGMTVVLGQGLLDYLLRNPVLVTVLWLLVGLLATLCPPGPTPGVSYSVVKSG